MLFTASTDSIGSTLASVSALGTDAFHCTDHLSLDTPWKLSPALACKNNSPIWRNTNQAAGSMLISELLCNGTLSWVYKSTVDAG